MGSDEPHPSAGREMESSHRERQVDRRDIEAEELIKNTPSRDAALRENKGDDGFWKADDKISLRP